MHQGWTMSAVIRRGPGRSAVLRVLGLGLTLSLGACGFHLAGSRPLPEPLSRVHIEVVAPYRVSEPPLEKALRLRLTRRGAVVQPRPGEGATLLRLSELSETRQVLSVGADGKALEFLLVTRVRYELLGGDRVWLPAETLTVSRDYSFSADQILPKEAEEERLRRYLQDELAERLLLRLETALRAMPPADSGAESAPDAAPAAAVAPPS